jgi:hypothetical protein
MRSSLAPLVVAVAIVLMTLLPLYLLSAGPAAVLLPTDSWNTVYYPLRFIPPMSPALGRALDAHGNWWLERFRDV